ncbi:hypothetical protein Tco_1283112 [Tanacetum coccineum]
MTGFIGPPSMSSSIEKQKDNTKALLVKLLERLGLENSTGSHSNPKPYVNPTVYYTSANTSPTGYPYFQAQPIPQVGPPPSFNHLTAHYTACTGDLYPVIALSHIPHVFLVSQHTWNQHLGHPGREVLRHLVSNNFISYNKEKPPVL